MLAYAPRPTRSGSPRTLLLVAAGHVALLAVALTIRTEYEQRAKDDPPDVTFVRPIKPPPPPQPTQEVPRKPTESTLDRPTVIIPTPGPSDPVDIGPPVRELDPVIGPEVEPIPPQPLPPLPTPTVVRKAPRFATPADLVRPPYPVAKQRTEEEASLRLSLAIDPRGRVTAVDPVGSADPIFLAAARRHILRYWKYQPATSDGEAIAARIVITLRFELER